MSGLYIGLISGTSTDGADAALVELGERRCTVRAAKTTPYPSDLGQQVRSLIDTPQVALPDLGALDVALGGFFAECALALLRDAGIDAADVTAIGHHGQTVYHQPNGPHPFSMQLGDPNVIVARTGITTVADLRRMDMAHGGQGAPLMSAFHEWLFGGSSEALAILNLGGIANVTVLRPDEPVRGFDTGPGNTLLDAWISARCGEPFDRDGAWSAGGSVDSALLQALLADPFFELDPPKSTGREYFHLAWLQRFLPPSGRRPKDRDVQATLAELTAVSAAQAITRHADGCSTVLVCGGGAHNKDVLERLKRLMPGRNVSTTADRGLPPDWVEAAGFAWLARERLARRPSSRPSVTGARQAVALGGVYLGKHE